jgi:hypothetical protein
MVPNLLTSVGVGQGDGDVMAFTLTCDIDYLLVGDEN